MTNKQNNGSSTKISTFADLKKDEEIAVRPQFTSEIKKFIELMRQGEIPVKDID